ncbi:hypothetical protein [uncultured Vibrio sp.]|uniref:hypothetical protein n=1 Tax=uncultured Vibrio sp. TaxID=114054 RepID=UPI0025F2E3AC|nr:hypothetical protein [uncultured Vibrio sp.]
MKWIFPLLLLLSFNSHATPLVIRLADNSAVTLSYEQISKEIPTNSFKTKLPWYEEPNAFTGMLVTDLISYLGKQPSDVTNVSFIALNDYAASSTIEDILKYEPIIAYKMNKNKMKIRNKGPYWLVFNVDKYQEIDNDIFYTQMVWQIDEIIIHSKP